MLSRYNSIKVLLAFKIAVSGMYSGIIKNKTGQAIAKKESSHGEGEVG